MEEIITIDGIQYILTYDQALTSDQKSQTISNIKKKSGCGCGNKLSQIGGMYNTLQGSPCATVNLLVPEITVTSITIGGNDCYSGMCDTTCTNIGCTTDIRDIDITYTNSGNDANIIPYLTVSKHGININDVIKNGAGRLIQTQNNDGTWEWSNPNTDPITTDYPGTNNTLGVTARGLISAYSITGNMSCLTAAKKTADLLVGKNPDGFGPDDPGITGKHKVYGQDITFLVEFADAWTRAGNDGSSYLTKANDYMTFMLNNPSRFCPTGCTGEPALASAIVQYNFAHRTPNLYGWDIRGWVEAAVKVGNMSLAQALVSNMIPLSGNLSSTATGVYPTGSSYVLGLSGYLYSYIMTGADYSAISEIYTKLMLELVTTTGPDYGSFKIYDVSFDGKVQSAAYALLALDLTNTDISSTVNYLVNAQSIGGMWIESDGTEYTEVDSEVIVALGSSVTPYIGIPTLIPALSSNPVTFSNVVLSRGANHICADWTS